MDKEEFEQYKEEVLEALKIYRKDIEEYPDAMWLNLQILWDDHKIKYKEWQEGDGYPSQPEGAHIFFYQVDKELLCIVDHLGETGEWRIPCAVRHLDDLLEMIKD